MLIVIVGFLPQLMVQPQAELKVLHWWPPSHGQAISPAANRHASMQTYHPLWQAEWRCLMKELPTCMDYLQQSKDVRTQLL